MQIGKVPLPNASRRSPSPRENELTVAGCPAALTTRPSPLIEAARHGVKCAFVQLGARITELRKAQSVTQ